MRRNRYPNKDALHEGNLQVLDENVGGVVVVNPVEELVLGVEELQDLLPIVL